MSPKRPVADKPEKTSVLGKTAKTAKAGVAAGKAGVAVGAVAGAQVGAGVGKVGDFLREQRLASRLSLRQVADLAGVSNPYLSQIERGLRKPSAEVLQQLAKALRISAEQLYVQAGLITPDSPAATRTSVEAAVLADHRLTPSQRTTLLEIHASFVALNGTGEETDPEQGPESEATTGD
ncbi:helix-turn-helix domain-containing protein [Nocardioides jishulii]|uniref:Helix-turn-helix transcriptional regulator n=1 Tax=Nocardioides jishulii TaxID=2575440 RepID=A0A4U2YQT1_9ACTN|nr:helix-turn-helix transcriptional regulator [Nocardioides jishulii]QCX26486.1 helix-turn-helix transcriptional regulator [Nocardioides jishulii]TKI63708.1 helix-turn-helix transcriptional regulator [Nocardioides jishulii]